MTLTHDALFFGRCVRKRHRQELQGKNCTNNQASQPVGSHPQNRQPHPSDGRTVPAPIARYGKNIPAHLIIFADIRESIHCKDFITPDVRPARAFNLFSHSFTLFSVQRCCRTGQGLKKENGLPDVSRFLVTPTGFKPVTS